MVDDDLGQQLILRSCSLDELKALKYEYQRGLLPESRHPFLVVRLVGVIREDPEEASGVDFASAIVMAGLEAWAPWGAVLDLTRLDYVWGDEMQNLLLAPQRWYHAVFPVRRMFGAVPEHFPVAVVGSELNRTALASLIASEMQWDPNTLLFENVREAVHSVDKQLGGVHLL